MTAWININKPTSSIWTNLNPMGKEQYDQASLTYDDSSTYYDGVNPNQWNDITKPTSSMWVNINKPI